MGALRPLLSLRRHENGAIFNAAIGLEFGAV